MSRVTVYLYKSLLVILSDHGAPRDKCKNVVTGHQGPISANQTLLLSIKDQ